MVKVSVIVPVYNEEAYLRECLDSLCRQTLSDIEIICVDDGSTDGSPVILREYAETHENITVLTQQNLYAGVARNRGLEAATGKYLYFPDADDFLESDALEQMYLQAERDSLEVLLCHYHRYGDHVKAVLNVNSDFRDSFLPKDREVFSGRDCKGAGVFQAVIGWAWDKLFLADFVRKCGYRFSEFRTSEDGFFVYMLMACAERIGVTDEKLVFHRLYNNHSLSNTRETDWKNGFLMFEMIWEELKRRGLYGVYERSFLGCAVSWQIWNLDTLHGREALLGCLHYIRECAEPKFGVLSRIGELPCESGCAARYQKILALTPEQLLCEKVLELTPRITGARRKGWVFPYELVPKGSRLVLWGAGNVGKAYYRQLALTGYCGEVHWTDRDYGTQGKAGFPVESPEAVLSAEYDLLLIAVTDKRKQYEVREQLIARGVRAEKILCIYADEEA